MANIIVATEEQIQEAVLSAVSKFFSGNRPDMIPTVELPDTICLPNALKVLEERKHSVNHVANFVN